MMPLLMNTLSEPGQLLIWGAILFAFSRIIGRLASRLTRPHLDSLGIATVSRGRERSIRLVEARLDVVDVAGPSHMTSAER